MMPGCCSVIGFYLHQSLVSWIKPFGSAILVSLTNTFSDWCLWLCEKLTGIRCCSAVFSESFVHVFCNLDSLLHFYSSIFNNCFPASFHDKTVFAKQNMSHFSNNTLKCIQKSELKTIYIKEKIFMIDDFKFYEKYHTHTQNAILSTGNLCKFIYWNDSSNKTTHILPYFVCV